MSGVGDPLRSESADSELIVATRQGDPRAFEELYRRYRARVRDLCERIVTDRNRAEDLTQDALLRAYLRLAQFDETRALWPWLAKIARNICLDALRSNKEISMQDHVLTASKIFTTEDTTFEQVLAREQSRKAEESVTRALAMLAPRERRVLFLREVERWTYRQIAAMDASSVNAVRNVAWRARNALKAILTRTA